MQVLSYDPVLRGTKQLLCSHSGTGSAAASQRENNHAVNEERVEEFLLVQRYIILATSWV